MADPVLPAVRPAFRSLACAIVPEAATLDETGWDEVEGIVEHALAERPPLVRRQLVAFIRLLQLLALLRFGRPLARLTVARRARLLAAVQRAPLFLLRRGLWGLRTLVFMGYYARRAAGDAIGYRASARGWAARHEVEGAVP